MNKYVTGTIIKKIREEKKMTQLDLAEKLSVSDKTISKWETGKGYPDITLLDPLAKALGVSIIELLSGNDVINTNCTSNMLRSKFYVCPVCGNVIWSTGETVISCHGVTLPPLEVESEDDENSKNHEIKVNLDDNEYYVTIDHEMKKEHSISFIAGISDNGVEIVKLYPEGEAEARLKRSRTRYIYAYCNHHGLYRVRCKK